MKLVLDMLLYVGCIFSLMLAVMIIPDETDDLLVVTHADTNKNAIFAILNNTDARLVEKISDRRFIVKGSDTNLVNALYENGAFLVLNAGSMYGCAAKFTNFAENRSSTNNNNSPFREKKL